ncbi:MAG TPA: DUF1439 domain-containing protein [Ramlibacter sp.]|nr:DUF1439 domain-containing protein [Ramlibacter sp.]
MKRRSILGAAAFVASAALGCASSRASDQPVYKVSIEQLQRVIAGRFPARYPVGNLFNLELEAPRLRLLPELNRLASEMVLDAAGPALRRSYRGSFDVDFALRYEPSDQSIRAHELRAHSFRLAGLPPQTLQLLQAYGQALAEQALLEVVLHRLSPRDLALADTMGLQPGDITVTAEGLVIGFVTKQGR